MRHGKAACIEWSERDKYGRVLGHVYVGDKWLNEYMIESGCAWHYVAYSSDKELADDEQRARAAKVGLWAEASPTAPWEYRKRGASVTSRNTAKPRASQPTARASRSTAPDIPPPIASDDYATVYVTKTGSKYHTGSCRHIRKSHTAMSLGEARARFGPCSVCRPLN